MSEVTDRRRVSKMTCWMLALAASLLTHTAFAAEIRVLRSGTVSGVPGTPGPFGGPADDNLTFFTGTACCVPLSAGAFTPADFASARTGPPAVLVWGEIPPWIASLPCDPDARWVWTSQTVSFSGGRPPYSTLFAYPFTITTPNATAANINICWASDDTLGDPSGPNSIGVYLGAPAAAGIPLPSTFAGGSFAAQTIAATNVPIATGQNWLYFYARDTAGSVAGLIFSATVEVLSSGPPGTVGCCGDMSCPCGNNGATCNGCANSANPAGASLTGSGAPFSEYPVPGGPDTVRLTASGMPSTATALLFKSSLIVPPTIFGDGLRCCGGNILRLSTGVATAGSVTFPLAGQNPLSVKGSSPAGEQACYQVYYRNATAAFCPPATFNVTNSYVINWL